MRLEAKKYSYDIQQAATRLADFTAGKRFEDYQSSAMLRAAVERQFEIIGELRALRPKAWAKIFPIAAPYCDTIWNCPCSQNLTTGVFVQNRHLPGA